MKITPFRPDIGQSYKNDFREKRIFPFNKIGRVVVDKDTAEILMWLGEDDSTLTKEGAPWVYDETRHDIMVHFPAFYYKRTWNGDVLEDSIFTEVPVKPVSPETGAEVFPCFLREDGSVRPYVLYGAFKGVELGGQLRSIVGQKPTVNKTISAFRDSARQGRDSRWNIETFGVISMVQFLYKIAFQDLDSQKIIGNGWTNKSESATVGTTMELGNRSGYLGVDGNQISLFGIEDFYGNIWSFADGFFVKDDGYYITNKPNKMGILSEHTHYPATPLMGANSNELVEGYFKTIEKGASVYNIPNLLGSSGTKNYTDYFWSHRRSQTNICRFGALWHHASRAGAFCLNLDFVASNSGSSIGARVCFLP
ncbi:MAG: hypothetical protein ACRDDY_03820 [Clostridium sp.]|uniref:hypothetical protein n=1 Tax=Clostridium sp. TaxID=1506 RepID=UPI003EE794D8